MAQRWHYQRNGQEHGPVTTADLRLLADSERLQQSDMVRQEGTTKWVPAGSVKGLFYAGAGRRPERASGGGATVAVVVVLILLLIAGGGAGAYYYFHGFGASAPVASPTPPADPPPSIPDPPPSIPDPPPPDPDPTPADPSGGGVGGEHKNRTFWRSNKGYFKNVEGNRWEERYGNDTFQYVEKEKKPAYIELYDAVRGITVRIHADHFDIKAGNVFKKQLDGHWESP